MNFFPYQTQDPAVIQSLFTQTFTDSAGEAEGQLIGKLAFELLQETPQADRSIFLASDQMQIIGAIIFSRLNYQSDVCAFVLGPVAIHTAYQNRGIGQQLIRYGLQTLKEQGLTLALTYGDPKFYRKVGFEPVAETQIAAPFPLAMPEGWLAQSLTDSPLPTLHDRPACVQALAKTEYW